MLMPDHGPTHPDDPGTFLQPTRFPTEQYNRMGFACIVTEGCHGGTGATGADGKILGRVNQAWAYQFGYIQSVVQIYSLTCLFCNKQWHFDC
jgi:hypothetical protein